MKHDWQKCYVLDKVILKNIFFLVCFCHIHSLFASLSDPPDDLATDKMKHTIPIKKKCSINIHWTLVETFWIISVQNKKKNKVLILETLQVIPLVNVANQNCIYMCNSVLIMESG